MHINDLSDDVLLAIFNALKAPYSQLLTLQLVHSRWSALIAILFRSKKSLKLFGHVYSFLWQISSLMKIEDNWSEMLERPLDDVIQFRGPPADAVAILPQLFPNLRSLVFNYPTQLLLEPFLQRWAVTLTSLTLLGPLSSQSRVPWVIINSLVSLKRLNIVDFESGHISDRLPVLFRLHHFGLRGYHGLDIISLLGQLGPNCKSFALERTTFSVGHVERLLRLCPFLATTLTILLLDLDDKLEDRQKLRNFVQNNFVNLTESYINLPLV